MADLRLTSPPEQNARSLPVPMMTWQSSESRHDYGQPKLSSRLLNYCTHVDLLRERGDHLVVQGVKRFGPVQLVYPSQPLGAVLYRQLRSAHG